MDATSGECTDCPFSVTTTVSCRDERELVLGIDTLTDSCPADFAGVRSDAFDDFDGVEFSSFDGP